MVDLARLPYAGGKIKKEMSEKYNIPVGSLKKQLPELLHRVEELHEFNPMLATAAAVSALPIPRSPKCKRGRSSKPSFKSRRRESR